jgi:uncharacterized protein
MDNQIAQLLLNVGFVAQQDIGYRRVFPFEFPILLLQPDHKFQKFKGSIEVSRTSEGLLSQGKIQAFVGATCSRCLDDFDQTLVAEFTELFVFASHAQEDTELIYPEDGQIDFGPIVLEYLLLEMPIKPVCKEACKGLCSVCGNNLNEEQCDHGPESIDPRMAVLKSLLDQD